MAIDKDWQGRSDEWVNALHKSHLQREHALNVNQAEHEKMSKLTNAEDRILTYKYGASQMIKIIYPYKHYQYEILSGAITHATIKRARDIFKSEERYL